MSSDRDGYTVLVTGASGYIASALIPQLHRRGCSVFGIDRTPAHESIRKLCSEFAHIDITCLKQVGALRYRHWDMVFHLAALCQVGESIEQPGLYMATNWKATETLLQQLCFGRFIFSSSAAARQPQYSPYAQSKLNAERAVRLLAPGRGNIARLYNVVGCSASKYTNNPDSLFARLVQARDTGVFTINGDDYSDSPDGTCVRSFIHVQDAARSLIGLSGRPADEKDAEPAELAYPNPITVRQFAEIFRRVNRCSFEIKTGGRREGDIPDSQIDKPAQCLATDYADLEKLAYLGDNGQNRNTTAAPDPEEQIATETQ